MSQGTNSTSSSSGLPSSRDEEDGGLKDVHDLLLAKVLRLNLETNNQKELLLNNPKQPTLDDHEDQHEDNMKRFAFCLLEETKLLNVDPVHNRHHVLQELCNEFQSDLDQMQEAIEMSTKELKANKIEAKAIAQQIEVLKKTLVKRETEGEMKEGLELDKKIAAVKNVLSQHKNWILRMIDELFDTHDDTMTNILRQLTSSHLKQEVDSYVEIAEDIDTIPVINLLYDAGLILRHPYDPKKIRFAGYE